jgi:hypothetical protein
MPSCPVLLRALTSAARCCRAIQARPAATTPYSCRDASRRGVLGVLGVLGVRRLRLGGPERLGHSGQPHGAVLDCVRRGPRRAACRRRPTSRPPPRSDQRRRRPMDPAIEAFEMLASIGVTLGDRHNASYDRLIHPVHQRGRVFTWEICSTAGSHAMSGGLRPCHDGGHGPGEC